MSPTARILLPLALLLSLAATGAPPHAQGGAGYSVDEVARMIRERGWKVLSSQQVKDDRGRVRYRFKLLHGDGRVKVLSVDPRAPALDSLK